MKQLTGLIGQPVKKNILLKMIREIPLKNDKGKYIYKMIWGMSFFLEKLYLALLK
jgi:hypothetical protein